MMGWKWFFRIPLIIFWAIAAPLSLTGNGFLTSLAQNHVTTTITLLTLSLYFLVYPFFAPFFPKLKTKGGEIMERSTKILVILLLIFVAVAVVAIVAPGAVVDFTQGTIIAPIVSGFIEVVAWFDTFRASHLLAAGLVGGLFLALAIKALDIPKRVRMATGNPKQTITPAGVQPLQGQLSQSGVFTDQPNQKIIVEDEVQ